MTAAVFKGLLKDYYQKIKDFDGFDKTRAQGGIKGILEMCADKEKFKSYDFYTTEGDYACEGMVILCSWGEDGSTPTFHFFKDGLKAEKY